MSSQIDVCVILFFFALSFSRHTLRNAPELIHRKSAKENVVCICENNNFHWKSYANRLILLNVRMTKIKYNKRKCDKINVCYLFTQVNCVLVKLWANVKIEQFFDSFKLYNFSSLSFE